MRLLISTTPPILPQLLPEYHRWAGLLLTPRNRQRLEWSYDLGIPFAADNDCFQGLHEERYKRMLVRLMGAPWCDWVTVPDVVADADATLAQWSIWAERVAQWCPRLAFVLQNGITSARVPWSDLTTVFVGGCTAWKMGEESAALIREAKGRGKMVHVGRVNSYRRMRHFHALGADSIDGTNVCKWPDRWIPPFLRALRSLDCQGELFPADD